MIYCPSNAINIMDEFTRKYIYLGIELLRFILCLWVVIIHCSIIKNEHKKYLLRGFHVPTFILISFYFYYPSIQKRNIIKINSRFQRLLLPYILWPILKLISNNFIISTGQFKTKLSVYDLFLQLLTGYQFHHIFWFQFNLIILSLYLTIISFIFKQKFLNVLKFLGIVSLYIHYSGTNFLIFSSFCKKFNVVLGSFLELMPLSIIGFIFRSINLLDVAKNIPLHLKFVLFFLIHFLFRYNIFIYYPGFKYPNIILNILASTILFLLFGSLDLNGLVIINSIIKFITKYTGGIYYIHPLIRVYLQN